jgi:hypothetical protein
VGDVHNDTDLVHFGHGGFAEVAEPTVMRLACAIAEGVAAVVGDMHHADPEVMKNANETQLVADTFPLHAQGNAVGGHAQADVPGFLEGDDFLGGGDFRKGGLEGIGGFGDVGEAFQETQGVAALLARILEDAGDARGLEGLEKLLAIPLVVDAGGLGHGLPEVREFR